MRLQPESPQSKRKSIRQERRRAAASGLRILRLRGDDIKHRHWEAFYKQG